MLVLIYTAILQAAAAEAMEGKAITKIVRQDQASWLLERERESERERKKKRERERERESERERERRLWVLLKRFYLSYH